MNLLRSLPRSLTLTTKLQKETHELVWHTNAFKSFKWFYQSCSSGDGGGRGQVGAHIKGVDGEAESAVCGVGHGTAHTEKTI